MTTEPSAPRFDTATASSGGQLVRIQVSVPGLLRDCTDGRGHFEIEAATLTDALSALLEAYPLLRLHLYDESQNLRPHVLIYFNDQNIRWLEENNLTLRHGDRLAVVQSVSGG